MDAVDEAGELSFEVHDLVLEVEVLVSDVATGLGNHADILDELTVAVDKALVVSTDGRGDEFSEQGEVMLVDCTHPGEFQNDREKEGGRIMGGRLKLGFKVRI